MSRQIRCAIYTRKSSEEGLDQDFNSLDAQREAGEAYIRSQAHEGWKCLPDRYDDGGHSGGTMERPALQRLLEAVRERRVDVIVIYKIDRLTRSLADFARLAELFDQCGASFVSVTQQFNTTTSMGRLMLNVLLSFAQFEREITGERIRDKIAASKKKGMWMGGTVPIGYRAVNRTLVVHEPEAETIRTIFSLYLEAGSVPALMDELERRDIRTRVRVVANKETGGLHFGRGHLYQLLSNPVYVGRIPHKKQSHQGTHQSIVDKPTWEAVQSKLATNTQGGRQRRKRAARDPSPLAGLLFAENGNRFRPSHANKGGQRYRYYVEELPEQVNQHAQRRPRRIPAPEIEGFVCEAVAGLLRTPQSVLDVLGLSAMGTIEDSLQASDMLGANLAASRADGWPAAMDRLVAKVVFGDAGVAIHLSRAGLRSVLELPTGEQNPDEAMSGAPFVMEIAASICTRGVRMKLVMKGQGKLRPERDRSLIRSVARAHDWFARLRTGKADSLDAIAKAEGLTSSYVGRVLRLAFMAPNIIENIVAGTQPRTIAVDHLILRTDMPRSWEQQPGWLENVGNQ
jgi:site-specific DNA recombinase